MTAWARVRPEMRDFSRKMGQNNGALRLLLFSGRNKMAEGVRWRHDAHQVHSINVSLQTIEWFITPPVIKMPDVNFTSRQQRGREWGSVAAVVWGGTEGSKVNSVVVTTSFGLVSPVGGWTDGRSEGALINLSWNFSNWQRCSCHDSLFNILGPVLKKITTKKKPTTLLFDTLLIDCMVEVST